MPQTLGKNERLKSKKLIDFLFKDGKSVLYYPIRIVYTPLLEGKEDDIIGVSVSKRYFKKAVDRNRLKRQMREIYRLNKPQMNVVCMFIYVAKEKITYQEIEKGMLKAFDKVKNAT